MTPMSGGFERRSQYGELLMATFATARRPLSFDDLVQVVMGRGARISDVADWMANARASGTIEDRGFELGPDGSPVGPRLFAIAPSARAVLRVDRRRRGAA